MRDGWYLPSLRDPVTNRATRAEREPLCPTTRCSSSAARSCSGSACPSTCVVHLAMSPAARARHTPPTSAWTLPAFERYDTEVAPARTRRRRGQGRRSAASGGASSTGSSIRRTIRAYGCDMTDVAAVRAVARLARVLERASGDLSMAHYRVLAAVADGDERASRVAARLALGKPTISASVDALCRHGLLTREDVEHDQRATTLRLTDAGATRTARGRGGDDATARAGARAHHPRRGSRCRAAPHRRRP